MFGRFVREEAGMTMALAVITMVIIGVMGAGLLTFVSTDLNAVVEVNQGQKALEMADTGVRAAQRQLAQDTGASDHYDGVNAGADNDLPWSYCYGVAGCTGASPTATGSVGMRLDRGSDSVNVTILETNAATSTYKVISEGRVGDARRKVEASIRLYPGVGIPGNYFTRGDLKISGSSDVKGISYFSLKNVNVTGSFDLGSEADGNYGRWADAPGTGSYPNPYNKTPRSSNLAGIGALGAITEGGGATAYRNSRSYDSATNPKVVANYDADGTPGQQATEIGFPFEVPTLSDDKQQMDTLRQMALDLEQANPGTSHYFDSNPGNGQDDAGLSNGNQSVDSWPANSTLSTVVFYKFAVYNNSNNIAYQTGPSDCTAPDVPKGVLVVENGDVDMTSNHCFQGGIIIRAYNASGDYHLTGGGFDGRGTADLKGYANSSGPVEINGSLIAGSSPGAGSLPAFRGNARVLSWRELYQ